MGSSLKFCGEGDGLIASKLAPTVETHSIVGASLLAKLLKGPPRFTLLHEGLGSLNAFLPGHRLAEPFGRFIQ
jgi:hypothetical protein